jgi:hypothetical protein
VVVRFPLHLVREPTAFTSTDPKVTVSQENREVVDRFPLHLVREPISFTSTFY